MFGNLGNMLSQLSEMKSKMKVMEEELRDLKVRGESRDHSVFVEISGKMEVKEVKINPEIFGNLSPLAMEGAIEEALSSALSQATQIVQQKMKEISGGLNIPGL